MRRGFRENWTPTPAKIPHTGTMSRRLAATVLSFAAFVGIGSYLALSTSAAAETPIINYSVWFDDGLPGAGGFYHGIEVQCSSISPEDVCDNGFTMTLTNQNGEITARGPANIEADNQVSGEIPVYPNLGETVHLFLGGQERESVVYDGSPSFDSIGCGSTEVTGNASNFTEALYEDSITQIEARASIVNGRFFYHRSKGFAEGEPFFLDLNRIEEIADGGRLTVGSGRELIPCPAKEPEAPVSPPANHPPRAHKDAGRSTGSPASGNVLANDTDPDADPLTLTSNTQGAFGSVECSSSGDCTYTPGKNYPGHDSFSYTISDGRGGTSSARDFIRAHPLPADGPVVLKQVHVDLGLTNGDFRLKHNLHLTHVSLSFVLGRNGVKKLAQIYVDNSFTDAEVASAIGGIACSELTPAGTFACGLAATAVSELLKSRIEAAAKNPQCLRLTLVAHFTPHVTFFHHLPVLASNAALTPSFHSFSGDDNETGLTCRNHF